MGRWPRVAGASAVRPRRRRRRRSPTAPAEARDVPADLASRSRPAHRDRAAAPWHADASPHRIHAVTVTQRGPSARARPPVIAPPALTVPAVGTSMTRPSRHGCDRHRRRLDRARGDDHRGRVPRPDSPIGLSEHARGATAAGIWRGASFSWKFAAVILVAGVTIAMVPLMLAEASARSQAENSAAHRVSIAASLIEGQRASLATFIAGVGRQLAAGHDVAYTGRDIQATLVEDGSVIGTDDVLGVVQADGALIAVQGATVIGGALPAASCSAATVGSRHRASSGGRHGSSPAHRSPGRTATVFVARPLTSAFINAVDHNIATAADPVGILLIARQPHARRGGQRRLAHTGARHRDRGIAARNRLARLPLSSRLRRPRSAPDSRLRSWRRSRACRSRGSRSCSSWR